VTRPTVALAAIKEGLERNKLYAYDVEADPPSGKYSVSLTQVKALEVNVAPVCCCQENPKCSRES
jgi:hypothetical protein